MELTNLLKLKATKSVIESIDTVKLVDVIEAFSVKQFGQYKDGFMSTLQDLMIGIIKAINERKNT
jgi:hypothetical protein